MVLRGWKNFIALALALITTPILQAQDRKAAFDRIAALFPWAQSLQTTNLKQRYNTSDPIQLHTDEQDRYNEIQKQFLQKNSSSRKRGEILYETLIAHKFPKPEDLLINAHEAIQHLELLSSLNMPNDDRELLFDVCCSKLEAIYPTNNNPKDSDTYLVALFEKITLNNHDQTFTGADLLARLSDTGFSCAKQNITSTMLSDRVYNTQRVTQEHLRAFALPLAFIQDNQDDDEIILAGKLFLKLMDDDFPALKRLLNTPLSAVKVLDAAHFLDIPGLPDALLYRIIQLYRSDTMLPHAIAQNNNLALAARIEALLNYGDKTFINRLNLSTKAAQFYQQVQPLEQAIRTREQQRLVAFLVATTVLYEQRIPVSRRARSRYSQPPSDTQDPTHLFLAFSRYILHPKSYILDRMPHCATLEGIAILTRDAIVSLSFFAALAQRENQRPTYIFFMLAFYMTYPDSTVLNDMPYSEILGPIARRLSKLKKGDFRDEIYLSKMFNTENHQSDFSAILPILLPLLEPLLGSQIRHISLYGNGLTGPIPQELCSLDCLYELNLSGNNFTGPIQESLLRIRDLKIDAHNQLAL